MLRRVLGLLGVAASLAFATQVNAQPQVVSTQLGSVNVNNVFNPVAGPPINNVVFLGYDPNSGLYTNQQTGAPFQPGSQIVTIGAMPLTNLQTTTGSFNAIAGPGGSTSSTVIAVFGVQGNVVGGSGGVFLGQFNAGTVQYFQRPTTAPAFDPNTPTTWLPAGSTLLATYTLKPQEAVVQGNPQAAPINFPAAVMNQSSANAVAGNQGNGRFIFLETSDPGNLINHTTGGPGPDAQFFDTSQTILTRGTGTQSNGNPVTPLSLTAADFAVLNGIAATTVPAGFFATIGTGTQTDFTPTFSLGTNTSGDFQANLSVRSTPGLEQTSSTVPTIPEMDPGSMAAGLALLASGFAMLNGRRRRK